MKLNSLDCFSFVVLLVFNIGKCFHVAHFLGQSEKCFMIKVWFDLLHYLDINKWKEGNFPSKMKLCLTSHDVQHTVYPTFLHCHRVRSVQALQLLP